MLISWSDLRRGVKPPWGFVLTSGASYYGSEYHFWPIAKALNARWWLWRHSFIAFMLWLYDLAVIDPGETTEVAHWWNNLATFSLRGSTIWKRQRTRWEPIGYERGRREGEEALRQKWQAVSNASAGRVQEDGKA